MKKLKELVKRAILVAYWRDGDVDTEDGTFATTSTDDMIHLESAIQDMFDLEAHELYSLLRSGEFLDKKLESLHMPNGMSELENNLKATLQDRIKELEKATQNRLEGLVITDQNGNTLEWEMCEGVVEVEIGADGLAKENHQEWKSGDKAMLDDSEVLVIGYHPEHPLIVIDTGDGLDTVGVSDLKKPNGKV